MSETSIYAEASPLVLGSAPDAASIGTTRAAARGLPIETIDLCHAVGDKTLVRDVRVTVRASEVLAVIGPSGAGKSSFLRLLNRLDEPTAGTVLLDGEDYRRIAPQALRRRIGMVMQTAHLFPGTVAHNLAFGPLQQGRSLGDDAIAALLERVGLGGYQDRLVSHLSGGEAQRVALARALANEPAVLLLDEPTSALDAVAARAVEALIAGIVRERGMSCVLVTHDPAQARRLAGRTMAMERGAAVAIGPTEEVLREH